MNVQKGEFVVGHVGFFNEQKNQSFLINIAKYLIIEKKQNIRLMLVGNGRLFEQTKELCKEYGIEDKVTFLGATNDINGVMSAMDVFVFPSRWEGLGIVMIEAQLIGLPCVASTAVPIETKISDSCRFIPLVADISEWADAIMLSCKESIENKLRILNLKNTERFDMKIQIKKLEDFYDSCD